MVEVIVNLLLNALDASTTGTEILVVARPGASGGAELSVRDFGCGVPEPVRTRIFEPFFTTKQSNGTGLGLSMARRIVDAAGGEIRLRAPPDGGAQFTIWLPASDTERDLRCPDAS